MVNWSVTLNRENVTFKRVGPAKQSTDHQLALNHLRLYHRQLTWIYHLNYHGRIVSSWLFDTVPLLAWSSIDDKFTGVISLPHGIPSFQRLHPSSRHHQNLKSTKDLYFQRPLTALKQPCLALCLGNCLGVFWDSTLTDHAFILPLILESTSSWVDLKVASFNTWVSRESQVLRRLDVVHSN